MATRIASERAPRPTARNYAGIVSVSLVLASAGCGAYMSAMTPTPRMAENPIVSGKALETSERARLGTLIESDCETWPFNNTLSVTVSEPSICIASRKHVMQEPGWTGEPPSNRSQMLSVTNDAGEGGTIGIDKVSASKVGSCFERGYKETVSIWAFDYKGCAPNNGTVTPTTKSLTVGNESWSFASEEAPSSSP